MKPAPLPTGNLTLRHPYHLLGQIGRESDPVVILQGPRRPGDIAAGLVEVYEPRRNCVYWAVVTDIRAA